MNWMNDVFIEAQSTASNFLPIKLILIASFVFIHEHIQQRASLYL